MSNWFWALGVAVWVNYAAWFLVERDEREAPAEEL